MGKRVSRVVQAGSELGLFEIKTLVLLLVLAGAAWGFIALAAEVREGETRNFDEAILLAMRSPYDSSDPIGPRWFEEACRDMTALGGVTVLVLVTLSSIVYLVMARRPRMALLVLVSVVGAQLLSTALKHGFDRPRPELVPHGSYVYTASFPSGHAAMAAVTYLTLGALLARAQPERRLKAFILGLAIFITLLVGFSRVYLGVHWPTDVLAGWTLGAGWAALVGMVARMLQARGAIRGADPLQSDEAAASSASLDL